MCLYRIELREKNNRFVKDICHGTIRGVASGRHLIFFLGNLGKMTLEIRQTNCETMRRMIKYENR